MGAAASTRHPPIAAQIRHAAEGEPGEAIKDIGEMAKNAAKVGASWRGLQIHVAPVGATATVQGGQQGSLCVREEGWGAPSTGQGHSQAERSKRHSG